MNKSDWFCSVLTSSTVCTDKHPWQDFRSNRIMTCLFVPALHVFRTLTPGSATSLVPSLVIGNFKSSSASWSNKPISLPSAEKSRSRQPSTADYLNANADDYFKSPDTKWGYSLHYAPRHTSNWLVWNSPQDTEVTTIPGNNSVTVQRRWKQIFHVSLSSCPRQAMSEN